MMLVFWWMAGEPRDFGPYHLVRRLGVGGMAETFEATRDAAGGFEQRVCLKRVLPAFSDDDEFVARFQREAKLAAQLRHTNIVGVVDFGEVGGVHYMTLELVDGVDLRSLLKSSPEEKLSPNTVALIGLDLAYALEHAHGSLVHRDISPSNVLLSRSGETKLADFGIAKAIDNVTATASRSAKGKIPYMSPEHMRGETVDGRADLFSLGVVLFEAAAGCRPFDGAHDVETMQKILEGDRRSLADAAPDVPLPLRDVIERLIEVDRGARTPSATRLIEELAAVAPPPEVRRQLASTVEGQRGGREARMHVRAREEERDTELSRPPSIAPARTDEEAAPPRKPPRTSLALMLAAGLVLSLVGAFTGTRWLDRRAEAPEAGSAAGSVPASVPVPVPAPAPAPVQVPAPVAAAMAAPVSPARLGKGWVYVVVQPWGNVWIDGLWMGRAPVKARLSKGRHVIEVGRDLPSKKRIVRVEPGSRKEIALSLAE
ncbi:MAG: serine/threonine protein kinase [Deltaproteobacteria bacterium]|nr:serine/threonine protein kinase [Deltaproteobacteria bacterium]